ncbi:hypothetical protein [Jiangella alba]|uniref:Peptidase inhibitor family I36 n=1 Tax=Jiangella alba TaxID=561176 RepID=A0A1H5PW98_9ACTN|nr:hypothetical protein [Jiangella alba]SEF18142.1 hypothetical protein SAMN04488561_6245 [Jiangella alba]
MSVTTRLRRRVAGVVAAAACAVTSLVVAAGPADAASLWHCQGTTTTETCTRVTSAPASGVRVYDRITGRTYTLYNGDSVYIRYWYRDTSGLCGVNGDPYVWQAYWTSADGQQHRVMIGDYYLATGPESYWRDFRSPYGGTLGSWYGGTGSGTCNVFRPGN